MNVDDEKSRKILKPSAPRPMLSLLEGCKIVESIVGSDISDLRDKALISMLFYNLLRLEPVLRMKPKDLFLHFKPPLMRVPNTNRGFQSSEEQHNMPCFPETETALIAYIRRADVASDLHGPLFRTLDPITGKITSKALSARSARASINERARQVGINRDISPHELRVAGSLLLGKQLRAIGWIEPRQPQME